MSCLWPVSSVPVLDTFRKETELFNLIPVIVVVMYSAAFLAVFGVTTDEPAGEKISAERQAILADMRTAVAAIKVSEQKGGTLQPARVVEEPIFRYSDPQRQIIDGTMWVWTIDDLPVMTMKLENYSNPEPDRRWLFNIGSCSQQVITVKSSFGLEYESKKPGLAFQRLEAGPKLSESKSGRLLQLKQLSRKFSATMLGAAGRDDKSQMRLLPTPLFRYFSKSGHVTDGALFGLSATGTNPDAIVAIQWREDGSTGYWEFACMGTTDCGLEIRLDEAEVWSQPTLFGQGPEFETWAFFFTGRIK